MTGTKHDAGKPRFDLVPAELYQGSAVDLPDILWAEQRVLSFARRNLDMEGGLAIALGNVTTCAIGGSVKYRAAEGLVAAVLTFGAEKYGARDWEGGIGWSRIANGVIRHIRAHRGGDILDDETRLPHLAHAMCGLCFLLRYTGDFEKYGKYDDRPEV